MLTYLKNFEGSITILGEKGTVRIGGVAANEVHHWEFDEKKDYDDKIKEASHNLIDRKICKDNKEDIVVILKEWIRQKNIDVIITTGGTGLTGRDITPEAVEEVADKQIPGFGEIFRNISLKTVGTSAIQSRACAVLANGKYIFALPGSSGGVTDAWDGILKHQLDINHKPCNFVELFPRLKEK